MVKRSNEKCFGPVRIRVAILWGLALVAGGIAASETQSAQDTPIQFRDERIVLPASTRIWRREVDVPTSIDYAWTHDNPVSQNGYIGRVRVLGDEALSEPLRFRVEAQPDKSSYEFCFCPLAPTSTRCTGRGPACYELEFDITEYSGVLYLTAPEEAGRSVGHYVRDFERQRVEVSAMAGDQKIYREVLVEPPQDTPDCSDYPDVDVDRYTCLFLVEDMEPPTAPDQALLDALPDKLVQPKANYELVFAEEFDGNSGRFPSGDCEGGLANLDADKWNFGLHWCRRSGPTGRTVSDASGRVLRDVAPRRLRLRHQHCRKVHLQVWIRRDRVHVRNLRLEPAESLHVSWRRFAGHPVRRREVQRADAQLRGAGQGPSPGNRRVRVLSEQKRELTGYWYNYKPYIFRPNTEPRYISNWTRYCYSGPLTTHINIFTAEQCAQRETVTVRKGLEWTPRGYRMLIKVKDLHDDYIVISKEQTLISRWRARSRSGTTTYATGHTRYTGSARDPFFEFLVPGNPESVLTNFAVGHSPMQIDFGAWSGSGADPHVDPGWVRMKVDYVRVFQPKDRYAGMEPVYE